MLLGDLLSHDAKIPGNNLAWKDIGFMPDVEGESKKNERYVENVDGNPISQDAVIFQLPEAISELHIAAAFGQNLTTDSFLRNLGAVYIQVIVRFFIILLPCP